MILLMIYEINHIWTAEMKWKWRNDRRSERNLCNCVKKPEENSGLQRGLNPWPGNAFVMLYQLRYEAMTCSQRFFIFKDDTVWFLLKIYTLEVIQRWIKWLNGKTMIFFLKKKKTCPCKFYCGNFATHRHGTRRSLWKGEGMVGEESVRTKHGPGVHRPRILDQVHGPPQLGPCPPQQQKLKKAEKRTINMMQINSIHSFSDKLSDKV